MGAGLLRFQFDISQGYTQLTLKLWSVGRELANVLIDALVNCLPVDETR